ncbi:MAG: hypothetical protein ACKVT2_12080 [Saprospiraceae bacterium]
MKKLILLAVLLNSVLVFSQNRNDPPEIAAPRVIVQTGIGAQWLGQGYKFYILSVERPLNPYWYLGLQGNFYLPNQPDYLYYFSEFLGGFEGGFHVRYFFHGRFSGRKSGLFLGPDIRFGSRQFQISLDNVFPPPPMPNYQKYKERTTKLMLRWGMQWEFGRATLELSVPFGIEVNKPTPFNSAELDPRTRVVLIPTMQLGMAF